MSSVMSLFFSCRSIKLPPRKIIWNRKLHFVSSSMNYKSHFLHTIIAFCIQLSTLWDKTCSSFQEGSCFKQRCQFPKWNKGRPCSCGSKRSAMFPPAVVIQLSVHQHKPIIIKTITVYMKLVGNMAFKSAQGLGPNSGHFFHVCRIRGSSDKEKHCAPFGASPK